LDEMRRQIREVEPPKPSTRLRTLEIDAVTTTAAHRATAALKLQHLIRGDLDWIVMRCLEKDRSRRYDTASALAQDVERHLRHEPIDARSPHPGYLLRKVIRRHRRLFAVTAVAFTGLLLAAIASTMLAIRATHAEQKSEQALRVFRKMLEEIGPTVSLHAKSGLDRDGVKWRAILDRVATQLPNELHDQPDLAAEVYHVFGKIYLASGQRPQAEAMLRSSLKLQRQYPPANPLELAQTNYDLGLALVMQGRSTEASGLLRDALALRRTALGPEHPEVVRTLEDLGFCLWVIGEHLQAEPLLREAVAIRRKCGTIDQLDNPNLTPLWSLSICLSFLGRFDEAEPLARQNLTLVQRLCEPRHPFVRSAYELLGDCLARQGDFAAALPQWRKALEIDRATLPAYHPMLVFSTYGVAHCLHQLGDLAGAEPLYRESLALWRQRIKMDDREFILRLDGLAGLLVQRGKFAEARDLLDEAWAELQDPKHAEWLDFWPEVIRGQIELLTAWAQVEQVRADAIANWRRRLQQFEEAVLARPPGPDRVNALRGLTSTYRDWAASDKSVSERAAFWRQRLRECSASPPDARYSLQH
jgi:tetratricopeptide (TPR) repeat protein